MQTWSFKAWISFVVLFLLILSGCNGTKPTELNGKVTLDGQPLEGADVQLMPANSKVAEYAGLSGPDGSFKIAILDAAKFQPGKYKVTAVKYVAKGDNKGLSGQPGIDVLQLKSMGLATNSLPAVYETPEQTPITVDLTLESPPIDVPLKSK